MREGDLRTVDVLGGHKTGHYLDQRDGRAAARRASGRDVLDAFCYDGLFGIRAAPAGATSVLCLDQSPRRASASCATRTQRCRRGVAFERADVMRALDARRELDARFGLVVVDPPAFARNRRELEGALRGYRALNTRALRLVQPGGHLVSASCSHAMSPAMFVDALAQAAHASGREAWLEELCGASLDHPALLTLPETSYLKCAFVRVG